MNDLLFDLNDLRIEISFSSFEELRLILSFYQENNITKINIPCKKDLKKQFLLSSIQISRDEFPNIDIIPHFSILNQFRKNKIKTQNDLIYFLKKTIYFGCKEVLLISGSQKRLTLDSVSSLNYLRNNNLVSKDHIKIGIAFNPYLPNFLFEEELLRLKQKIKTGLVNSIWFQFGTNYNLFNSRFNLVEEIIYEATKNNSLNSKITLYGSILVPSRQFLSRFKFRPWRGVYCSPEFLQSVDFAQDVVSKILLIYRKYRICPIIETDTSNKNSLEALKNILEI